MTLQTNPLNGKFIVHSLNDLIEDTRYRYLYSANKAFEDWDDVAYTKCMKKTDLIETTPETLHWVLAGDSLELYSGLTLLAGFPFDFYEFYFN